MLYDPKWEKAKTIIDPISVHGLIAWLETKDPATTYNWARCDGSCLIGQYLGSLGRDWNEGEDYFLVQGGREFKPMLVAAMVPHTFGAALQRAISVRDLGKIV